MYGATGTKTVTGGSKTKAMNFRQGSPTHAVVSRATRRAAVLAGTRSMLDMEDRISACDTSRDSLSSICCSRSPNGISKPRSVSVLSTWVESSDLAEYLGEDLSAHKTHAGLPVRFRGVPCCFAPQSVLLFASCHPRP